MKTPPVWRLIPYLVLIGLTGCGGPPSESTGRKTLDHQIREQSQGHIKLVIFKKTNGKGDANYYQVEYEAKIEFLDTGAWSSGNAMSSSREFGFALRQAGNNPMLQLMGGMTGDVDVQKGQQQAITGTLVYEKTEKGWRGPDGGIY